MNTVHVMDGCSEAEKAGMTAYDERVRGKSKRDLGQDNRDSQMNLKKKKKTPQTLQFGNILRKKKEGDKKL